MIKSYFLIALRTLLRQRTFTLINILGLAIGLASALLISISVREDLLCDRFNENYDNVYRVVQIQKFGGVKEQHVSFNQLPLVPAMIRDLPQVVSGSRYRPVGLHGVRLNADDVAIPVGNVVLADSAFLDLFSYPMVWGERDSQLRRPDGVLLSQETALKLFGDVNPVGREIIFRKDETLVVTGVVGKPSTPSHQRFDMILPMSGFANFYGEDPENWGGNGTTAYVQLAEGVTGADVEEAFPDFIHQYRTTERVTFYLQPLRDFHLRSGHIKYDHQSGRGDMQDVSAYAAIAVIMLVIAGINFVNLATARSLRRSREVGVRKVNGASRGSLIRQFLFESLFLGLLSMLLAGLIAQLAAPYFSTLIGKEVNLNILDFGFTTFWLIGLSVFLGLLAGLYPAFVLSSFSPVVALRSAGDRGTGGRWIRRGLVIFQFATAVFLLLAASVLYLQLDFTHTVDIGFDREQVLSIDNIRSVPRDQMASIRERIAQLPGVVSASLVMDDPVGSTSQSTFRFAGFADEGWMASFYSMDPSALQTFGFTMVDGRWFSEDWGTDSKTGDEEISALILNQTAVASLGLEQPVGTLLDAGSWKGEVIGVVKDFHNVSLSQPIEPVLLFDEPEYFYRLCVRIDTDRYEEAIAGLEAFWQVEDPSNPFRYKFLDEYFEQLYASEKTAQRQLIVFSLLAILVAMIGLFGLASYTMSRRKRELGIRKVLGAGETGLLVLATKEFVYLILAANLIAWPIAGYVMRRWLENYVYRIDLSWWLFPAVAVVSLVVTLLTVAGQAWHTTRVNPTDILRHE